MRVRFIFLLALLMATGSAFGPAQDKPTSKVECEARRCAPKLISHTNEKSPAIHIRQGETYMRSPVVAFEILESGTVANPVLKRSSGAVEVDEHALRWVRRLKFNQRTGCGVVESQVDVTIDFR